MDDNGVFVKSLKPENIHDPIVVRIICDLLIRYSELINILDNDPNEYIQSIGKDLRNNLRNIQKIVEVAESDLIAQKLINPKNINYLVEINLYELQNLFKKLGLGE